MRRRRRGFEIQSTFVIPDFCLRNLQSEKLVIENCLNKKKRLEGNRGAKTAHQFNELINLHFLAG
jgi:uncharacterized protein YacL